MQILPPVVRIVLSVVLVIAAGVLVYESIENGAKLRLVIFSIALLYGLWNLYGGIKGMRKN